MGKQASNEEEIEEKTLEEQNSQIQVRGVLAAMGVSKTGLALQLCSLSDVYFFEVYEDP